MNFSVEIDECFTTRFGHLQTLIWGGSTSCHHFFLFIRKKIALFSSTARMYTLNISPQWNVNYYKLHKYIYIQTHRTARHSQMSKSLLISRDMHRLLSVNTDDNPSVRFANFFPWPVIETVVRPLMVQIHRVHFIQFLWHNRN